MMTNFREILGIPHLTDACGYDKDERDSRQKKAITNIRHCTNDQWGYVNSWYDEKSESARAYMLDAKQLFDTIYYESQKNIYSFGSVRFGGVCESWLKDIRFCGSRFLKKVCLYNTARIMEEAFYEVEGTEEDAQKIIADLKEIMSSIE